MIPIKQDGVTQLVDEKTRVVDLLKQYGRMPVMRITPAKRSIEDKASKPPRAPDCEVTALSCGDALSELESRS